MLEILKTLNDDQRDVLADIALVCSCLIFLLGYGMKMITDSVDTKVGTWRDVIVLMPASVKRDIAIDYCVAHKHLCRNLPVSSPINPMDSKGI